MSLKFALANLQTGRLTGCFSFPLRLNISELGTINAALTLKKYQFLFWKIVTLLFISLK